VATKDKKTPKEKPPKETTVEFMASMASVLVTGLFIITFVLQPFEIPSGSMENTLLIGDHVLVNRVQLAPPTSWVQKLLAYRPIRHDDIVVFLSPSTPGMYVVKRILGIPGDRIHLRDGFVYRNGEKLAEPYLLNQPPSPYDPYRNSFPSQAPTEADHLFPPWQLSLPQYIDGEDLVVPPGRYFGMGDNRDNSYDSRYWGFIPRENILGRPMFIYWSFETPRDQYEHREISERAQNLLHVVIHFFDQTRWKRTLQVIR
jgi:signal peptidase I